VERFDPRPLGDRGPEQDARHRHLFERTDEGPDSVRIAEERLDPGCTERLGARPIASRSADHVA
jgi:hypothetical protein